MLKKSLIALFSVALIIGCTKQNSFNESSPSTSKQKTVKTQEAASNTTGEVKDGANQIAQQPCCSVNCKKGDCSAYGSSCSCTCGWFGQPDCEGSEYPTHINHTPESIAKYNKMVDYLHSIEDDTPEATELISLIEDYLSFVEQHEYNFTIDDQQTLDTYKGLLSDFNSYEQYFSEDQIAHMYNL